MFSELENVWACIRLAVANVLVELRTGTLGYLQANVLESIEVLAQGVTDLIMGIEQTIIGVFLAPTTSAASTTSIEHGKT